QRERLRIARHAGGALAQLLWDSAFRHEEVHQEVELVVLCGGFYVEIRYVKFVRLDVRVSAPRFHIARKGRDLDPRCSIRLDGDACDSCFVVISLGPYVPAVDVEVRERVALVDDVRSELYV